MSETFCRLSGGRSGNIRGVRNGGHRPDLGVAPDGDVCSRPLPVATALWPQERGTGVGHVSGSVGSRLHAGVAHGPAHLLERQDPPHQRISGDRSAADALSALVR